MGLVLSQSHPATWSSILKSFDEALTSKLESLLQSVQSSRTANPDIVADAISQLAEFHLTTQEEKGVIFRGEVKLASQPARGKLTSRKRKRIMIAEEALIVVGSQGISVRHRKVSAAHLIFLE